MKRMTSLTLSKKEEEINPNLCRLHKTLSTNISNTLHINLNNHLHNGDSLNLNGVNNNRLKATFTILNKDKVISHQSE